MSTGNLEKIKDFSKMRNRLKEIRLNKNLSLKRLGELCSVSKNTIKKWEDGSYFPNALGLYKLAEYYDVSVDYLMCRTDNPEVNKETPKDNSKITK